jgi:hypothetical protein
MIRRCPARSSTHDAVRPILISRARSFHRALPITSVQPSSLFPDLPTVAAFDRQGIQETLTRATNTCASQCAKSSVAVLESHRYSLCPIQRSRAGSPRGIRNVLAEPSTCCIRLVRLGFLNLEMRRCAWKSEYPISPGWCRHLSFEMPYSATIRILCPRP